MVTGVVRATPLVPGRGVMDRVLGMGGTALEVNVVWGGVALVEVVRLVGSEVVVAGAVTGLAPRRPKTGGYLRT
jgi:hypothetical protein